MNFQDTIKGAILFVIFAVIFMGIGGAIGVHYFCKCEPCQTKDTTYTIPPVNQKPVQVYSGKPIPVKVEKLPKYDDESKISNSDNLLSEDEVKLRDFAIISHYDTTFCAPDYELRIQDTVNGTITGRSIHFTDFRGTKYISTTTTVNVTSKVPLCKVFLGVFGGTKFQGETGVSGASFGGDVTTVWNDRFMVRGSVDGLQRSAQVGFGVKLSFR